MILSDHSIKEQIAAGRIVIDPLDPKDIQPASIDIHLGNEVLVFRNHTRGFIDVRIPSDDLTESISMHESVPFMLHPGEFVLAGSKEFIGVPEDILGRLDGKSSLGRIGLLIHSTAGFIDPGWRGRLTLELSNVSKLPITLYSGMAIGQISFMKLTTPAENPYGSAALRSKYQNQAGPTPTRLYREMT